MASYAYYALHHLKIRIRDFYEMSERERIATIAFIRCRIDSEKKLEQKYKR